MRVGTLSVLVLILLAMPTAAAQLPTEVTSSLVISGLPAQVQGLAENTTTSVPFSVDYSVNGNFLCPPGGVNVPITISLQQGGAASFITATLDTTEGTVPIGQGPHQGASGSVAGTITIVVGEVTANASVPLTLTAEAGAVDCPPGIPSASAEGATAYANMTYTPPPPPPPEEPNDSPGFEVVGAVLAVAVAVSIMRRKRT